MTLTHRLSTRTTPTPAPVRLFSSFRSFVRSCLLPAPQFPTAFPNYEIQRYSPQPSYPAYPRSTPPLISNPADSRRLPPLSTSSSPPPAERWPQQHFVPQPAFPPSNNIRSPMASYPAPNQFMQQYPHTHQPNVYQYPMSHPDSHLFDDVRIEPRSNSPFTAAPDRQPSPPVSPTSPEEPTVKKKRRRADANQLKVLNETYARTAFPSTEERIALAKMLDMSARSVQIWSVLSSPFVLLTTPT
jgi:homeobox protein YOX1/YHP1